MRAWLQRLPSADTKQYVGNFLSVFRVRPAAEADSNSDDDNADTKFQLNHENLGKALRTQMPPQKKNGTKAWNDDRSQDVAAAFACLETFWARPSFGDNTPQTTTGFAQLDAEAIQKAARKKPTATVPRDTTVPAVITSEETPDYVTKVARWKQTLANSSVCNAEQTQFCHQVADRIVQELNDLRDGTEDAGGSSEPLRWVLHGGPGTGKSYTLRLLREKLFEETLCWQHGVQFQIVSFQAVMADLLGGDTIHHALGLDWNGDSASNALRAWERARHTLQWRWLILDEFSMVSAELLAQLELRCRELIRDLGVSKYRRHAGDSRPFGGLNIILARDLYQLPPPKGMFLGDIPWDLVAGRKASKRATGHHGQTLLWGGPSSGMQGVTELVRCERTADAWLTEVQQQLRYGQLSNDNHAFLHGRPTSVPGSWLGGRITCGNAVCGKIASANASPEQILAQECRHCRTERCARQRVATADDPRVAAAFADAVAIFPTNDIKYHANKLRALEWASARQRHLYIAVAQDTASSAVLNEKPHLADDKLQWLQRHDKECGGLYGVLPLCIGMPVRAADHLDRARGILRGCKGIVLGWSDSQGDVSDGVTLWNKLPAVVYVKFETSTPFQITGLSEPNVYPVSVTKRTWFLDRQRKFPRLRIRRVQFPLVPGFAITAHVGQGQTLREGVIADLCLGPGSNCFTAYVAFTRVAGREYLLILRPFDAAPFQKGIGLGRELLLRHLRGECIDWKALLAKYCEERSCSVCGERRQNCAFTAGQWKRDDTARVCRECTKHYADIGTPWQCNVCKQWHVEDNFPMKHRQRQCSFYRVCLTCEVKKPCTTCKVAKPESDFGAAAWKARHADRRICRACAVRVRGCWTCTSCENRMPKADFSAWCRRRAHTENGTQTCNYCFQSLALFRCAHRTRQRLRTLRTKLQRQKKEKILDQVRADISTIVRSRLPSSCQASVPQEASHQVPPKIEEQCLAEPDGKQTKEAEPKAWQEAIAEEVRKEIDKIVVERKNNIAAAAAQPAAGPTPRTQHAPSPPEGANRPPQAHAARAAQQQYTYKCPACQEAVQSSVFTGKVQTRGHCGRQFRVAGGVVCNRYVHACPTCKTPVESTRPHGRIQKTHKTPQGRECKTSQWQVAKPREPGPS